MARNRHLGHAESYDSLGNVVVTEKLTCPHCQRIYDKPKPGADFGFCHRCFSPVCIPCGKLDRCDPFEEKLRRLESRDRLLKSVGA
jgi:hypothetical protein